MTYASYMNIKSLRIWEELSKTNSFFRVCFPCSVVVHTLTVHLNRRQKIYLTIYSEAVEV